MCKYEIFEVDGSAAYLSVEVCTAKAESAITDNFEHSLSEFEVIDWELVGIPSVLCITSVCIDRTQHTLINGTGKFVFECMTCQSSVVHLYIQFEVLVESVSTKESNYSLCI